MSADDKILLSEFNEAVTQIVRLGNIWQNCHNYSRKGDLNSYKWELDRAWIELGPDAREMDSDYYVKGIEKINKAIEKATNKTLYILLQKKESFLRDLQEAAGKGGKKQAQYGRTM